MPPTLTDSQIEALEAASNPQAAIEKIIRVNGLALPMDHPLVKTFYPLCVEVRNLVAQSAPIAVEDENDTLGMKAAREARLAIRAVRIVAENGRKEHKADIIKTWKIIEGLANLVKDVAEPEEARLQALEDMAKLAEERRQEQIKRERIEQIRETGADPYQFNLDGMNEVSYQNLIRDCRAAKQVRDEQAAKIKAEQEAAAKAKADEDARIRAENETLRVENAKAATARQQAEATRKEAEDKLIAIQNDAKAKADADAKAARKAARAPDAQKIRSVVVSIRTLRDSLPQCKTPEGAAAMQRVYEELHVLANSADMAANRLD